MNYVIDFDHTLYNTPLLTRDMLIALASYISKTSNDNYDDILKALISKFKRGASNIYDIYDLIAYFSQNIYHYDEKEATSIVDKVIFNGQKYLFDDAIPFLQYLRKKGNTIYILSYNETKVYFQTVKIAGSSLLKFVDGVIPTTILKGNMPLDFPKCIFIDDKPKDLVSIYQKKPCQVFRIRRPGDTYSDLDIDSKLHIPEFRSLADLMQKLQRDENEYTQ